MTLRRDLLHVPVCSLPAKREGAYLGAGGDPPRGGFGQEGRGGHRVAVRCLLLKESTVSRLAVALGSELEGWRHRPLEPENYPYLFVWMRAARRSRSAPGSSARASWSSLRSARSAFGGSWLQRWRMPRARRTTRSCFRTVKERVLKGVELVTSDEQKDLKSAIE